MTKSEKFVEGVNIIAKYMTVENMGVHGEHDIIYFGSYDSVTDDNDIKRLDELGWFEEEESWAIFT